MISSEGRGKPRDTDSRVQERRTVASLVAVIGVLWLGFFVHRSPAFPGSFVGVALGILAAAAMLSAAAHSVVRRLPAVRQALAGGMDVRRLVQAHVYIGAVAAVLALLHSGHKFQSTLGIALTAAVLLLVLSGFAGRHLLALIGEDERELQDRREVLKAAYARMQSDMQAEREPPPGIAPIELAESLADLDYGIAARGRLKRLFSGWLLVHMSTCIALLVLLVLHIWAAFQFSLRWPW